MRKYMFLILICQALAVNAFAQSRAVDHSGLNNGLEVEDLASPSNMLVEYFSTKQEKSNKLAFLRSRKLITNGGLLKYFLMVPHTDPVNVMPVVNTRPIFWGASWNNPKFYSDKIFGLMHWYENFQDSTYASTVSEYLPSKLHHSFFGIMIDSSPANSDPEMVLNKICELAGGTINSKSDYYPVYTDIKRGNASYCAYHSAGTCGGRPIQFAFFFDIDDDPDCDPQSPYAPPAKTIYSQKPGMIVGMNSNYQQSQGLAALVNVSSHELVEVITDPGYFPPNGNPYWGGWFDIFGAENADKCAWTFGPSNTGLSPGTVSVGAFDWKLQGTWSNSAQITGEGGYPTQRGVLVGCVTGS